MKAAVDTNVLLDLLASDQNASESAKQVLATALGAGPVVICPVVFTELGAGFDRREELLGFLHDLGIQLEAFSGEALSHAAAAWRSYVQRRGQRAQCPKCGHTFEISCPACGSRVAWRQHILSDFLIGGHALVQADLLVTRDAGYYRRYFPQLRLVVPVAAG